MKFTDGRRVAGLLEQCLAHLKMWPSVRRLQRRRQLELFRRRVETAKLNQQDAEVEVRLEGVRIQLQGGLVFRQRCVRLTGRIEQIGDVVVRVRAVRIDLQRLPVLLHGLGVTALLFINDAEVEMRDFIVPRHGHGVSKKRFIRPPVSQLTLRGQHAAGENQNCQRHGNLFYP